MKAETARIRQVTLLLLFIVFILSGSAFSESAELEVISEDAVIRTMPNISSRVLKTIPPGTILIYEAKINDWFRVILNGERTIVLHGYIHQSLVEVVTAEPDIPAPPPAAESIQNQWEPIHYGQPRAKHPMPVMVGLNSSYYFPPDQTFKTVYGNGFYFAGEVALGAFRNLDIWINAGYLGRKGETTFSEEETTLRIIPLSAGVRYRMALGRFEPYGAVGASYHLFKETSPLGEAEKGGIGIVGRVGSLVEIVKFLSLDVYAKYTYCRIEPAGISINIGGFRIGAGLVLRF